MSKHLKKKLQNKKDKQEQAVANEDYELALNTKTRIEDLQNKLTTTLKVKK